MLACQSGHVEVVLLLIDTGADMHLMNEVSEIKEMTYLFEVCASQKKHDEL